MFVLIAAEVESTRTSVREEIEAANRVASQLLGRLAEVYSRVGGPDLVLQFLQQLGRVRANEVSLRTADRRSPVSLAAGHVQGRTRGAGVVRTSIGAATVRLIHFRCAAAYCSWCKRSHRERCSTPGTTSPGFAAFAAAMFVVVNALAFWSVKRALEPFPVIAEGLERVQRGDLSFRLPLLAGSEAQTIGIAFNRMAQAVEDKVLAERKARMPRRAWRNGGKWLRWPTNASKKSGA